MREIKFRGFSPIEEKWYFGSFVKTGTGAGYIIPQNLISENIPQFRVDVNSVGQFTGLKDKNGKEIYEGDVVQIKGHAFEGSMKIDGNYMVGYNEYMELCCGDLILFRQLPYVTVIANQFENPLLLY